MMSEFAIGVMFGILLCFAIGHFLFQAARKRVDHVIDEMLKPAKESVEQAGVPVRVERHDGIFYIYRVKDNSFLAQGVDLAEIREKVEAVTKDLHVYIAEGDEDVIQALKDTKTTT